MKTLDQPKSLTTISVVTDGVPLVIPILVGLSSSPPKKYTYLLLQWRRSEGRVRTWLKLDLCRSFLSSISPSPSSEMCVCLNFANGSIYHLLGCCCFMRTLHRPETSCLEIVKTFFFSTNMTLYVTTISNFLGGISNFWT